MNALLICSVLLSQNAPPQCICSPIPETIAVIGLPVILQAKGLPPLSGTVLVAWPLEAHQIAMGGTNPQTGRPMAVLDRPRSLYVLVEFDTGGIEWWNITDLRIDVEKRKKQREMMFPPYPQHLPQSTPGYGQGQQQAPQGSVPQQQFTPPRSPPTVSESREPKTAAIYPPQARRLP